MSDEERHGEAIDRLVRRFLRSQEERVDAKAFLASLKGRRRRMRVLRDLVRPALAAAAALLIVAVILLSVARRPHRMVRPDGSPDSTAVPGWQAAVSEDMSAAWRGARDVGGAALSAGETPLVRLAQADVPELPEGLGGLLDSMLGRASELTVRAGPALRQMMKNVDLSLDSEEAVP